MPPLYLGLSLEVLMCINGLNFTTIQFDLKYKMDKSPLSCLPAHEFYRIGNHVQAQVTTSLQNN